MDKYDVEKLKAVTLYILKKCGATDYIHLFKILYFAEKEHYADYGKRITKDTFIAMEHGPVPSFLYNALKLVTKQEQVSQGDRRLTIHSRSYSVSIGKKSASAGRNRIFQRLLHLYADSEINVLAVTEMK